MIGSVEIRNSDNFSLNQQFYFFCYYLNALSTWFLSKKTSVGVSMTCTIELFTKFGFGGQFGLCLSLSVIWAMLELQRDLGYA